MSTTAPTKKATKRATKALEASDNGKATKNGFLPGFEKEVDTAVRRKFMAEEAKNLYADIEGELITKAEELYEQAAGAGKPVKSLNFAGKDFEGLNISFSDSFSGIQPDTKDQIVQAYVESGMSDEEAEEAFNENFELVPTVKLAETGDETIAALDMLLNFARLMVEGEVTDNDMKRFQSDMRGRSQRGVKFSFGDIFSSDVKLVPTKGMDVRQFEQPESVRRFLKQKKASTRVKVAVATEAATDQAITEVAAAIREKATKNTKK